MAAVIMPRQHRSSPIPCIPTDSDTDKKCPGGPNHCACAFLCIVGGSVLIAGLLLYYLFLRALSESNHPDYLESLGCHRNDCFTSKGLLTETLNASIDPCLDFKKYVTSRWLSDPSGDASEQWNYKWNVKYLWMRKVVDQIRGPYFTSPPESMVASSFRACESRSAENATETRAIFKELLRTLDIPWPEQPTGDRDPFEVHFNLCVRWNMPLWFDVRLLPEEALKSRRAIYVDPSVYAKFWGSQYRSMGDDATVRRYIDQYVLHFDVDDGAANTSTQRVDTYRVFTFTRRTTFMLESVHRKSGPEFHTFESLAKAFGLRPGRFVALMNSYFRPRKDFSPHDVAVVKKKGTAQAVRYITANHDPALLRSHLGWWVLQIYAPIADASFFVQKYGSKELAHLITPLFCETQMESSFKILLFAKNVDINFPEELRRKVQDVLNNVREQTAVLYEQSGSRVGADVGRKFRRMNVNLWPKPEYRWPDKLRLIYASHNTSKSTSLDHWITERRANAELIGTDAYFEDKRLPHSFSKEPIFYDSLLNEVSMSMLLAYQPFFYPDGDAAINHGGLGAAFSSALLAGGLLTEVADPTTTLENAADNDSLTTIHEATNVFRIDEPLPKIAERGFLPAFRALQALKHQQAKAHTFSEEKLFFISYCHTQTRVRRSFDCNAVLQGADSFVSAFNCKKGSRMNP
ncbi:hypothetical protein HPB52_017034 [Rhipicephalus sanguineus]|uniref:Peptidase M13 N-terminal domain-containing protein n=1 Tax=Rhipicephalus sanguineus TaxID=34632 RepID=A0A9D4QBF2_RHISA|nr:hypothetical protein HPB52_017034 [Rhipicephalus sanguineus]